MVVVCWVRALHGPGPPLGAPALAGLVPAWEGSWVRCGLKSPRLGAHPRGDRSWVDEGGGDRTGAPACNNSRWPGRTLSTFIVNEEIIKSILQS